jgi:hypothetical protein
MGKIRRNRVGTQRSWRKTATKETYSTPSERPSMTNPPPLPHFERVMIIWSPWSRKYTFSIHVHDIEKSAGLVNSQEL